MILNELFDNDFSQTPQHTEHDDFAQLKLDDTRKPKLTLAKIHSLRKLREYKDFLNLKHQSLVSIMYGESGNDNSGF